jgi:hypothetical protein
VPGALRPSSDEEVGFDATLAVSSDPGWAVSLPLCPVQWRPLDTEQMLQARGGRSLRQGPVRHSQVSTAPMCPLVLAARRPTPRLTLARFPPGLLGGSFRSPPAAGGSGCPLATGCMAPLSPGLPRTCLFCLRRTPSLGQGQCHLTPTCFPSTRSHVQTSLFQIRSHSELPSGHEF